MNVAVLSRGGVLGYRTGGWAPNLVLFAKTPVAGRVKTRLAEQIGTAEALRFYRQASFKLTRKLGQHKKLWRPFLAVCPDNAMYEAGPPAWAPGWRRIGQGKGNLGMRLTRLIRTVPPGPVVIIGSDAPQVTLQDIRTAFAALRRHDCVIGPATDGGFWLFGIRRHRPMASLLEAVHWSTPTTLSDTLHSLPGWVRVCFLRELQDVDTVADLRQVKGTLHLCA